jgi:hypothetical protein
MKTRNFFFRRKQGTKNRAKRKETETRSNKGKQQKAHGHVDNGKLAITAYMPHMPRLIPIAYCCDQRFATA